MKETIEFFGGMLVIAVFVMVIVVIWEPTFFNMRLLASFSVAVIVLMIVYTAITKNKNP